MSDAKRRYLRLYFDDLELDHPDVWYDPTCLSTFVRLLALSEKAWPAMPELPRAIRRADLDKLKGSGMIELLDNHRYVLRGWVAERSKRAEVGRANVGKRADRTVVPTPVPTTVTTPVLPVRARAASSSSFSIANEAEDARDTDAWDAFTIRTGEVPGPKLREWLNDLSEAHGEARVVAMLELVPKTQRNSVDYLKAVRDALRAADFEAEKAERAAEKSRTASKRAPLRIPTPATDISEAEAKRLALEYHRASKGEVA